MGVVQLEMMTGAGAVNAASAVTFRSVTCCFASNAGKRSVEPYTAVKDVSLNILDGEFVSVVGPTGCGKSTLLNVAAGLLRPTSGTIEIFGTPLLGINRDAGYMFQAESLMAWRSALRNVMVGLEYHGVPRKEAHERAMTWLSKVGLSGFEDRRLLKWRPN